MNMGIEETRDDRAATKIDSLRVGAKRNGLANIDDATIADRQPCSDNATPVDEFSVGQSKVSSSLRRTHEDSAAGHDGCASEAAFQPFPSRRSLHRPSNFAALPPRMAIRSASLSPGVPRM